MKVNIKALSLLVALIVIATALILWIVFSAVPVDGNTIIYTVVGLLCFFLFMSLLYYKLVFRQIRHSRRLQKNGLPGRALIINVKDTGVTVSENPQVALQLEVTDERGAVYHTSLRVVVSRINPFAYRPGMTIPVKIDPKNRMLVAIDTDESG